MKDLFDLSFNKFIAPRIATIVYVLIMVVIAIGYLIVAVSSFQVSSLLGVLYLIIIGPILALFYLVLARVGLESLIATIRTAENTQKLVDMNGGQALGTAYPQPPAGNIPPEPRQGPHA